jgi:predicted Rossmann-fold nucleotide-binding protein
MKLTIGVMGSSGDELNPEVKSKVFRLGRSDPERDAILITGGCPGLPYEAVRGRDKAHPQDQEARN